MSDYYGYQRCRWLNTGVDIDILCINDIFKTKINIKQPNLEQSLTVADSCTHNIRPICMNVYTSTILLQIRSNS